MVAIVCPETFFFFSEDQPKRESDPPPPALAFAVINLRVRALDDLLRKYGRSEHTMVGAQKVFASLPVRRVLKHDKLSIGS